MPELPGKEVKCTRDLKITIVGFGGYTFQVPSTFQSVAQGPEGFFRILDSDGILHMYNPRFVVGMEISAEVETDMEIKEGQDPPE